MIRNMCHGNKRDQKKRLEGTRNYSSKESVGVTTRRMNERSKLEPDWRMGIVLKELDKLINARI